jgi:hypothetical protein
MVDCRAGKLPECGNAQIIRGSLLSATVEPKYFRERPLRSDKDARTICPTRCAHSNCSPQYWN